MASRRASRATVVLLGAAVLAGIGYALRWRSNPSPCPYSQRLWVDLPRPIVTRVAGPARSATGGTNPRVRTGYYTGTVARAVEHDGSVHAVDVKRAMVEHLRARTR